MEYPENDFQLVVCYLYKRMSYLTVTVSLNSHFTHTQPLCVGWKLFESKICLLLYICRFCRIVMLKFSV